jgi:hypothetical protein
MSSHCRLIAVNVRIFVSQIVHVLFVFIQIPALNAEKKNSFSSPRLDWNILSWFKWRPAGRTPLKMADFRRDMATILSSLDCSPWRYSLSSKKSTSRGYKLSGRPQAAEDSRGKRPRCPAASKRSTIPICRKTEALANARGKSGINARRRRRPVSPRVNFIPSKRKCHCTCGLDP